ncbi:MAG: EpsG family protein [Crocinitomicaceae bacterium]|nr:EpsG family protein [Crocinitomicaceae bacterium]
MIYFVLFILLTISSFNEDRKIYFLILILLFTFSAFRSNVGCDWEGYLINFESVQGYDYEEMLFILGKEPLYTFLLYIMDKFKLEYYYLNIFTSFIFFWGVNKLLQVCDKKILFLALAFPILIINMPMSAIRQSAAMGFLLVSFYCFIKGKDLQFCFWIMIATFFHSSVLIFVILIFARSRKLSFVNILFYSISIVVLYNTIVYSERLSQAHDAYFNSGYDARGALYRILFGLIMVIFTMAIKIPIKLNIMYPRWKYLVLFSMLPVMIWPFSTITADRLNYYVMPIQILSNISCVSSIRGNISLLYHVLLVVLYLFFFLVWILKSELFWQCYIPYEMVF